MEGVTRLAAVLCLLVVAGEFLVISSAQRALSQSHPTSLKAKKVVNCKKEISNIVGYLNRIDASIASALKKVKVVKATKLLESARTEIYKIRVLVSQFKFSNALGNGRKVNKDLQGARKLARSLDVDSALSILKSLTDKLTLVKSCTATPPSASPSRAPVVSPTQAPSKTPLTPIKLPVSSPAPSQVPAKAPTFASATPAPKSSTSHTSEPAPGITEVPTSTPKAGSVPTGSPAQVLTPIKLPTTSPEAIKEPAETPIFASPTPAPKPATPPTSESSPAVSAAPASTPKPGSIPTGSPAQVLTPIKLPTSPPVAGEAPAEAPTFASPTPGPKPSTTP